MRFRLGMVIGFGAGYMMGAKAGRYRYDQIVRSVNNFWASDKAQEIRETARGVVEQVQTSAGDMVHGMKDETIKLDQDLPGRVDPYVSAAGLSDSNNN